jgi:serine/threonine protein phosphatase PrpC
MWLSNMNSKPFQVGIGSSVGMQREKNEDALFAMSMNLVTNSASIPMGLFIVADGMGGHVSGEKASELAAQAMIQQILPELIPPFLGLVENREADELKEIMAAGIRAAHLSIQANAPGGGSTLTGLLLFEDWMTIAHIGDSRAYLFDVDQDPRVLTTDHSLVKRLEDLGQITADEAAIHPQRNVLYRALGQVEPVEAELISTRIPPSGQITICSDGLWGAVPDQEIWRIIQGASDPQVACDLLLAAANAAGGPDNISVIIIKLTN